MKKVILMAACLFTLNTINAQEPTAASKPKGKAVAAKQQGENKMSAEKRAQKTVDKINQMAGLAEDQKTKIYDLALTRAKGVDGVREKYKGQADKKETAQTEIAEIRKTFRKDAKTVLTPEQLEKVKTAAKANKAAKNKGAGTDSVLDDQD